MPFIPNDERPGLNANPALARKPGHLAYLVYREMKSRWKKNPSWTTADKIHLDFVADPENNAFMEGLFAQVICAGYNEVCNAAQLAWQVFFQLVVMPYEIKKRQESGDVE